MSFIIKEIVKSFVISAAAGAGWQTAEAIFEEYDLGDFIVKKTKKLFPKKEKEEGSE